MKAVIFEQYGAPEVLQIRDLPMPTPKPNELLVKIHATAVNSGDCRLRKADPFAARFFLGLFKPKLQVLGGVFSGEVVAVGSAVGRFKVGDAVFGATGMSFGAYAEFRCFPEDGIFAHKPLNINHIEAAVIPFGATTALHFLRKANLQKGQKMLVYGASGAVGSAAVQLGKYFGAEVTGVCSSANVELVRGLGADKVLDYTKEQPLETGEKYEVVFDTVNKLPVSTGFRLLAPKGALILSAAGLSEMLKGLVLGWLKSKKVLIGLTQQTPADIEFLAKLAASGDLRAVIDQTFPIDHIAAAHAYVDKGHKKGNVGIQVVAPATF